MEEGENLQAELDKEISNLRPDEKETLKNQEENATSVKAQEEQPDKTFQSLDAQKRFYRDKAEKLEKQLNEKRVVGESSMDIVKLGQALAGHTADEVDFIQRNSKSGKAEDIIAASKDRMVRLAIEANRKETADKKKVLGSSSPEFGGGGTADWKKIEAMKPAEFQKYEEDQLRGGQGI